MVDVDKSVVARLKKQGHIFEVLVDCDNAVALKEGKSVDMNDVLADKKIFTDSKKGFIVSETVLKAVLGTGIIDEAAAIVIKEGELQLTAEYRAKLSERKTKRILSYIHRNGIDPRTGLPHPMQRIELALEEAKIKIDDYKPDDKQIQDIVKKLKSILPISFATKEMSIRIPADDAAKTYGAVHRAIGEMGKVTKNELMGDGAWFGVVEIPAGLQNDLIDKVNAITHGTADIKILKTK